MSIRMGGQASIRQLKREGIDTVFGLPGIQVDWAFDAICDERDHFRVVQWVRIRAELLTCPSCERFLFVPLS